MKVVAMWSCVVVLLLMQLTAADVMLQDVIRMVQQPRELERFNTNNKEGPLTAFSWSNCGSASDPVLLKNFTLGPDPVKLPGNISVSVGVTVGVALTSPVEISLEIKKKIGFWIPIPCIDGLGSCTYPDICQLLKNNITCPPEFHKYGIPCTCPVKQLDLSLKKKTFLGWVTIPCVDNIGSCKYSDACALLASITCPPEFQKYHIPCQCPIGQGGYYLPAISVAVPLPPDVPSWLDDGDYEVQATLKASGKELACFKINLSIAK